MDVEQQKKETRNPATLTVADVAKLLSFRKGETITPTMIESDLLAGAPNNPDGTIHLIHYVAWLAKEDLSAD